MFYNCKDVELTVDVPQLQGCGTAPFAFQGSFLTPSGLPQAPTFDVRVILHGFCNLDLTFLRTLSLTDARMIRMMFKC